MVTNNYAKIMKAVISLNCLYVYQNWTRLEELFHFSPNFE